MKILLFILLFITVSAFAQNANKSSVTLGALYTSNMIYRGALIYDAPLVIPIFNFVYRDFITMSGNGLSFYKRFGKHSTFAVGPSFFKNKPIGMITRESDKEFIKQRHPTHGAFASYNLNLAKIAMELSYHKDLGRHYGNYYFGRFSYSLLPFVIVGIGYGSGDENNNRYLYGPEAKSGDGHRDLFMSIFWPFLTGTLSLNVLNSRVVQTKNQAADYIRGHDSNFNLSTTMTWSF